jgi:hypothetical protein
MTKISLPLLTLALASMASAHQLAACPLGSLVTMTTVLSPEDDPEDVASRNNFELLGEVIKGTRVFEFAVACASTETHAQTVLMVEAAFARNRDALDPAIARGGYEFQKKRDRFTRSLYQPASTQWSMMDAENAATGHVMGARARGRYGAGSRIVVLDDGIDLTHDDLSQGIDVSLCANYNSGDPSDPTPKA